MGGGWWVLMLVFWLLVLASIVWALTRSFASGSVRGDRDHALRDTPGEELDRRLARGEIDPESSAPPAVAPARKRSRCDDAPPTRAIRSGDSAVSAVCPDPCPLELGAGADQRLAVVGFCA